MLTVLGEADRGTRKRRHVWVRCACGVHKVVASHNLVHRGVKSCGCSKSLMAGRTHRERYGYPVPGHQARNYVYLNYRSNAAKRGREFAITREEFYELTHKVCFYCGTPPSNKVKDRNGDGVFAYTGLDRLDPARGYTMDNVVPACIVCNRAKTDMSRDDFYAWVRRVASRIEEVN